MATGILGAEDLAADNNTVVYTVPNETFAVVTVSVTNRSSNAVKVRIAISDNSSPDNAEYLEFDTELLANGVLERSGIVIDAGKNVVVYSDSSNVNAISFGIETSTS